jgi:phage tail sheath protein FI
MPTYQNPGVYVTESAFVSKPKQSNAARSSAAFFGEAARGPSNATLISSWSEYRTLYGELNQSHDLGFAVYHYFSNGGKDAYITRITSTTAAAATVTATYSPNIGGSASTVATLFTASAISKGTWGNGLTIEFTSGNTSATSTVMPSFNLTVKLDGVEVERWNDLSPNAADNRYLVTILNTYSMYLDNVVIGNPAPVATISSGTSSAFAYKTTSTSFSGGVAGSAVQASDYVAALTKLDAVEGVLLLNAVNKSESTIINPFIAKAESRGDSFVIIDPSMSEVNVTTIGSSIVGGYTVSNYAAVYYPHLLMLDPSKTGPGAVKATAPGGAIAGAFVRTEIERGVAKTPAGFNVILRNAIGIGTPFTATETGTLYGSYNINTLKTVPGGGIVVNGGRTLDKNPPGKFISARRTLNYLKQALKDATAYAVFEPNDERLWSQLSIGISSMLAEFWRQGNLKGSTPADAFYVTCSSSNNSAISVDNGEVRIEVGVALQYPAEFIVINLSQWTGGSNAIETI